MQEMKLSGRLENDKVIVKENGEETFNSGWYGKFENGVLELDFIEALSLMEREKLELHSHKDIVNFREFYNHCYNGNPKFSALYTVYRDLRERGLTVRLGFKGTDLRVYDRGAKPDKKTDVKWIVFIESEDYPCELSKLGKLMGLAENIRAVALWAVVDNDSDVTYYIVQDKTKQL